MPGKHPKKRSVVPDGEPTAAAPPPAGDASAAKLHAQMAILADQVRRLGDRVGRTDDAWAATVTQPIVTQPPAAQPALAESPPIGSAAVEHAATPQPSPSDPSAVSAPVTDAAPAPRAHAVSVPLAIARPTAPAHHGPPEPAVAAAPAGEHDEQSIAQRTSRLMASVIETAERVAEQIRESAEREAARIRAGAMSEPPAADSRVLDFPGSRDCSPDLAASEAGLEVLERQRQALAALAAESEGIEAATEFLRAQARALDAERQRLDEAIGAARRTL
jgi:hypothetical protein